MLEVWGAGTHVGAVQGLNRETMSRSSNTLFVLEQKRGQTQGAKNSEMVRPTGYVHKQ